MKYHRIIDCEETNISLKGGITDNKKLAETQEEEFRGEIRKAERKTQEVLTLIENLKVLLPFIIFLRVGIDID